MRGGMWQATVVAQFVRCRLYQGQWWKEPWRWQERDKAFSAKPSVVDFGSLFKIERPLVLVQRSTFNRSTAHSPTKSKALLYSIKTASLSRYIASPGSCFVVTISQTNFRSIRAPMVSKKC